MLTDERIKKALSLKNLRKRSLPASMPVKRLEIEGIVNHVGEDALRVTIVLAEDVDQESVSGDDVISLKGAIHESLIADGIKLFPYIFLATESELLEQESTE